METIASFRVAEQQLITEPAWDAVLAWISYSKLNAEDFLFPSRIHASPHLSTRQYARIVDSWVLQLGLDTTSHVQATCVRYVR